MRLAVLPVLLALAACGGGASDSGVRVDTNQLERLSQPKEAPKGADPRTSARPQALTGADLRGAGLPDPPRCDFSNDGHRLFAAQGDRAITRIENQIFRFIQSNPATASGAFVSDGQMSISIGRTDVIDPGGTGDDRWPARLTATNRRTHVQVELTGTWRCAAT